MKENTHEKPDNSELRKKAEERLKQKINDASCYQPSKPSETDILKLLHELEVSKIELELQNEELRLEKAKTGIVVEQFTSIYNELYEFSPTGYFTLNSSGIISELNTSGVRLLEKERSVLINHDFRLFISHESLPVFNTFLQNVFKNKTKQVCEVQLMNENDPITYVHIEGIFSENTQKCLLTTIDITEHKLVEKALKDSEAIFTQFLQNSPIYVFFKDENIRSLRMSQNYENMLGKPMNELLGKTMDELFPSNIAKSMVADDLKILKEGKKIVVEEAFNERHYSTIKFPIHLDGKPDYLAGFTLDITESKLAQSALMKSEEKYRKLHQSLRDGFVFVSMDGKIKESNTVYQEMLGYSQEELEKLSYFDITPEKWRQIEDKIVADNILPDGFSSVYEKEYCKKDGSVFPVELRTFLIYDDDGQPQGMWAIVRDITSRKITEEALRASEEKFKSIVESSPTAMYFYHLENDDRLILIGANPAADKILGISHQKLFGKTIEEAFSKLAETEVPEMYKKIAKGQLSHQSFEILYEDERFKGYYRVSAFRTGINTIAVDFLDISDRKKAEEMLKQNQARLIELNATKDKFFSIIAHDLKNPFNSILGFSDILLIEAKNTENPAIRHYSEIINVASRHTYKLLENLLTWARMQSGNVSFKPRAIFFDVLIKEEFLIAKNSASQKYIQLLSNASKDFIVKADENMLRNILRNLISNAIKFTPKNGQVQVEAINQDNQIVISVTDTGIGIKPKAIEKPFKIETNFSTRGTENEKGTGLGLLLCKEFVGKHGGKIWVESKEGKGSKFSFTIPDI